MVAFARCNYKLSVRAISEFSNKNLCRVVGSIPGIEKISADKNVINCSFSYVIHHSRKRAPQLSAALLTFIRGKSYVRSIEIYIRAV